MPRKIRRYQPARAKLEKAINDILDKAINADSKNAPKQLHLILTTEHPEWKLPERRVAKYLKRQLKERNDDKYKDIDADIDEASIIYDESSVGTWRTVESKVADAAPESIAVKSRAVSKAYDDDNDKTKKEPLFCDCEGGCIIS